MQRELALDRRPNCLADAPQPFFVAESAAAAVLVSTAPVLPSSARLSAQWWSPPSICSSLKYWSATRCSGPFSSRNQITPCPATRCRTEQRGESANAPLTRAAVARGQGTAVHAGGQKNTGISAAARLLGLEPHTARCVEGRHDCRVLPCATVSHDGLATPKDVSGFVDLLSLHASRHVMVVNYHTCRMHGCDVDLVLAQGCAGGAHSWARLAGAPDGSGLLHSLRADPCEPCANASRSRGLARARPATILTKGEGTGKATMVADNESRRQTTTMQITSAAAAAPAERLGVCVWHCSAGSPKGLSLGL